MALATSFRRILAIGVAVVVLGTGLVPAAATAAEQPDYTDLVNVFVSTEDDFGQDLPGAEAPNSIIKINPMTTPNRSHSGYDYDSNQITGFTHTNLDGVGGSGGGGDLLVVPTYSNYTHRPDRATYAKGYSHDGEDAEPGYYGVDLASDQGDIFAEATTDVRTGRERFTFEQAGTASLVVDLSNNFTRRNNATLDVAALDDGRVALSGEFGGHFNGYDYTMHYYVETTEAVRTARTWSGSSELAAATSRDGNDIGAVLEYDAAAGAQLGLKVAISPISAEQAKIDLDAEMGVRSFDEVREQTKTAWNEILGRLAVTASETSDPDGELQTLFYTHLYRMFGMPMNATSTSGTYRGLDGEIHVADGYTHYDGWGFWDDFRKYEILAIGYPDVFHDIAQSIVDLYATFAQSGKGSLSQAIHSVPTVRFERAAVVVADAVAKGAKLDGLDAAWPALVSQSQGGYSNADNERRGYIANEVDDTLGTAYDDWAMATIADALGKTEEAQTFRLRAANWTNLYKDDAVTLADGTKTGLMFPKNDAGAWNDADPERFEAGNVYQGTLWQYNWYAASDMGGLIEKMGGDETVLKALSFMFGEHAPDDGRRMLHSNANEIDLQAPYLFNYVGAPSKTQHWVRSIYTKETWNRYIATGSTGEHPSSGGEFTPAIKTRVYKNDPQGFLPTMDNDTGTMSATFVAAAMGLFPVLAGSDEYQIGSPFFENVRISYPSGRTFDISADGVSADDYYIQSATLNGESFDRTWVTYDQLTAGGALEFEMAATPSEWAADGVAGSSLNDELPSSVYDPVSALTLSSRRFSEAPAGDGSIGDSITLGLSNGSFAGENGDDLTDAISAENLPKGLTLSAERTGNRAVALTLEGTAENSGSLDSIDDLELTVSDAAFSRRPSTGTREFTLRVDFVGTTLTASASQVVAAPDGTLDAVITLTLGGARFAGEADRDLVADGALSLPGLPESIAARAMLSDSGTAELQLSGSLGELTGGEFTLAFEDGAFDGVAAATVRGDGISGLGSFRIHRDEPWRERLSALLADAELVFQGAYAPTSFTVFETARIGAREALADEASTSEQLRAAHTALTKAAGTLKIAQSAYRVLEAESFDASSGGRLQPETTNDAIGGTVGNIGGVTVGSWIAYDGMEFGETLPVRVKLRYANHPGDSATDEVVEVRVGAVDGPVAASVEVPVTEGWSDFATVEAEIADPSVLAGSNRLYFVFGGTVGTGNSWVVNLDWAHFLTTAEDPETPPAPVRIEAETYLEDNGNGLMKEGVPPAGNVGGTWDGGQLVYAAHDFGAGELTQVTVNASTRDERVGDNPRLEFYLDEVGEEARVGTVALPKTGGWGNYVETTVPLDRPVSGTRALIVVMRADAIAGQEYNYVGNLQWYEFSPDGQQPPDLTALTAAIEEGSALLAAEERYVAIDFAVFRSALDEAIRVAGTAGVVQAQVDEAARVLALATAQLDFAVARRLPLLIAQAETVDQNAHAPEQIDALNVALTIARSVQDGATYEEYAEAVAALSAALDALTSPAPSLAVLVTASTRMLAGKGYVSVAVKNGDSVPVAVVVETAYGAKSFAAVQPGKSANVLINSRETSIPAGEVSVVVTGVVGDEELTVEKTVSYDAVG